MQFFVCDAAGLGIVHRYSSFFVESGEQREDEEDYAEASDPLGHGTPQKYSFAERFNVGESRGAGGGESRHGFKEGIGDAEGCPAEDEWEHAEDGEYNP